MKPSQEWKREEKRRKLLNKTPLKINNFHEELLEEEEVLASSETTTVVMMMMEIEEDPLYNNPMDTHNDPMDIELQVTSPTSL